MIEIILILGLVIILQFIYIIYKDRAERAERENLQLKLISKDVSEYQKAVEKVPEDTVQNEEPYVPLEDVEVDKLIRAEDKT